MKRKKGFLPALVLFLLALSLALESPFHSTLFSPLSENANVFGNPAAVGLRGTQSLLSLSSEEGKFSRVGFGWQGNSTALGYRYTHRGEISEFQGAFREQMFTDFHLGLKGAYRMAPVENYWTLDFGMQWSPFSALKFGIFTRDALHDAQVASLPVQYSGAIGVRPLEGYTTWGQRLTLSQEWNWISRQFKEGDPTLTLDLRPLPWFHIQWRQSEKNWNHFSTGIVAQLSPNALLGSAITRRPVRSAEVVALFHGNYKKQPLAIPGAIAVVNLNNEIFEGRAQPSLFGTPDKIGMANLFERFLLLQNSPGLKAVLIEVGDVRCSLPLATALRREIQKLNQKGIKTVAYMETTSRLDYYIASAAQRIAMPPNSYFDVRGFAAEISLYKGLLDKAGVQAQFVKMGDYKSYPEMFTEIEVSKEWQENLESNLKSLWKNYVASIADSRKIDTKDLDSILSRPEVTVQSAQASKLIDTTLYRDQLTKYALGFLPQIYKPTSTIPYREKWKRADKVALIYVEGTLVSGESNPGNFLLDAMAGSKTLSQLLKEARLSNEIRAVVLRINSPGGDAVASDALLREMELLVKEKPVVVSVGGVCASGAYLLAAPASRIVVEETSILGSIGIFGGKFVLKGLYDKLGIRKQAFLSNPYADAHSLYRPWDSVEVGAIREYMAGFYGHFKSVVEIGRKLQEGKIDSLAGGRIFTGSQAVSNGLADKIGGLETSMAELKKILDVRELEAVPLNGTAQSGFLRFFQSKNSAEKWVTDMMKWEKTLSSVTMWAMSPEAFIYGSELK